MSLESMKARVRYYGGAAQQDRMIRDKWKSMLSATKYSYQAARFTKYPEMDKTVPGLFNPVSNTLDADTKLLSVGSDSGYQVGDVFKWENTQTYWICYNQDLTELAYFRGKCRRCSYKVKWVDDRRHLRETYLSIVGPTQPDFRTYNPGYGLSIDAPTANLMVLTTNNEQNRLYFNQNQKFILQGITYKIHQVDNLSMPGIIQMDCQQDYTNQIEDDVEENVMNTWNIQPVVQTYPTEYGIIGPTAIKPLFPYKFEAITAGGHWYIEENQGKNTMLYLPVKFKDFDVYQREIVLTWERAKSGFFTLCYENADKVVFKKQIVVESLM